MLKSIKLRVLLIFVLVSVIPLAVFITWEYNQSIERLSKRSFEQLKAVRQIKKRELEWYFSKIKTETGLFAQSNFAVEAMNEFKVAFEEMKAAPLPTNYREELHTIYQDQLRNVPIENKKNIEVEKLLPINNRSVLLQNQYLIGTKATLKSLPYFDVHSKFHKSLSAFIHRYDIYDLFLIEDNTGYIVYSVSKEIDFATSLLTGAFADSNIGRLFRNLRHTGLKNGTMMCDFERYMPSNFAPAMFIGAPIFEGEIKIGTLILQVPLNKIDEITTGTRAWDDEGLGETGETYIVGSDNKMRTDSRFMIESPSKYIETIKNAGTAKEEEINLMSHYKTSVLFQEVSTEPVEKALANASGTMTALDYRKIKVLSSYAPLNIENMSWVMLAEIDYDEVFLSSQRGAKKSIIILSIVAFITFIISTLLARTIYKPIRDLAAGASQLGKGQFDVHFDVKNNDELGVLAKNLNQAVSSLRKRREEILSKNKLLNEQKEELAIKSKKLLSLNNEISILNKSLDKKVKERTLKLQQQNDKLIEYAHFNSHQLRSPISTILGLLDLISICENDEDRNNSIEFLKKATMDLDELVHYAQNLLDSAEFKDIS